LSGVARVFNTKRQLLQTLGDFPRAWSLLLEFIENSALSKNNEVMVSGYQYSMGPVHSFSVWQFFLIGIPLGLVEFYSELREKKRNYVVTRGHFHYQFYV
jgi:hypothetical protein